MVESTIAVGPGVGTADTAIAVVMAITVAATTVATAPDTDTEPRRRSARQHSARRQWAQRSHPIVGSIPTASESVIRSFGQNKAAAELPRRPVCGCGERLTSSRPKLQHGA